MAVRRFDQLPDAGLLTGTEIVPVMKGAVTARTTASSLLLATSAPRKLCLYYSVPEAVNGLYDIEYAISLFGTFDQVVLGTGLELIANTYHASTVELIARLPWVQFFGYLDVSVTYANYTPAEMRTRIDAWAAMGCKGMFYDVAGFAYEVTRARLNDVVQYAHGRGMSVCANDFDPDAILGNAIDPAYNPSGTPTALGPGDYYLLESWVHNSTAYTTNGGWALISDIKGRAEKCVAYRSDLGVKLWCANIIDWSTHTAAEVDNVWSVVEAFALAYAIDAYALGPPDYSATGATALQVRTFPYRPIAHRPAGMPHYNGAWTQITSAGAGQLIHYNDGATPAHSVTPYRGS